MGVIMYSVNLNGCPKMSCGVFDCDTVYVAEQHAYDFVIKKRRYLRQTLYALEKQ